MPRVKARCPHYLHGDKFETGEVYDLDPMDVNMVVGSGLAAVIGPGELDAAGADEPEGAGADAQAKAEAKARKDAELELEAKAKAALELEAKAKAAAAASAEQAPAADPAIKPKRGRKPASAEKPADDPTDGAPPKVRRAKKRKTYKRTDLNPAG